MHFVQSQKMQCYDRIIKTNVNMLIFTLYNKMFQKPANVPSVYGIKLFPTPPIFTEYLYIYYGEDLTRFVSVNAITPCTCGVLSTEEVNANRSTSSAKPPPPSTIIQARPNRINYPAHERLGNNEFRKGFRERRRGEIEIGASRAFCVRYWVTRWVPRSSVASQQLAPRSPLMHLRQSSC